MPKLESFTLEVKTGKRSGPATPKFNINGFPLEFDEVEGVAEAGQTLRLTGSPQSFPHTLTLMGPEEGAWDIESVVVEYNCMGEEPYTIRMGPVSLDDESDLNIWYERPLQTFDV